MAVSDSKKYPPVILLHGEESFLVQREMEKVEKNANDPEFEDFNKFVFYGQDVKADRIIDQATTRPMMGEPQLIMIKNANQFKEWDKLLSYVKSPVDFTVFVVVHPGSKIDGRFKFVKEVKALAKKGQAQIFEGKRIYDNKIPDWIAAEVKSRKLKIDQKAAILLSEYLGSNLEGIVKELDKLTINLPEGSKEITTKLIDKFVGQSRRYSVFELQKALSAGDKEKAAHIASIMSQDPKSNPIYMFTGALYNYFARIYRVHSLKSKTDSTVAKALNLRYDFFGREYLMASKYFNRPRCEKAFEILYRFDLQSKGIDSPNLSEESRMRGMVSEILELI